MADNETKVVISGDASGASKANEQAAAATEQGAKRIQGALGGVGGAFQGLLGHFSAFSGAAKQHTEAAAGATEEMGNKISGSVGALKGTLGTLGEAFGKVSGVFMGLAAVVGGGAFFKEAIKESNKLTGEVLKLTKAFGMSGEEAGTLNTALGMIGSDADTYTATFQKFSLQLRKDEEGIQAMGVATRDSAGHLRDANDVFTDGLKVVGQYKPGIDQTAAAQKLFGRSIDDVMTLQKLNNGILDEAREKNEALGLVVTQKNVEGAKAYKLAMHDVGEVMTAVMKVIGDTVMPIFTELGQYLASTGPYVVSVFKGALTGLMLVFRSLQAVVKVVVAVISEFINTTIDQLGNLSDMIGNLLSGNFSKAADAAVRMKDRAVASFVNIKDAATDAAKEASDAFAGDLDTLYGPKVAAKGGGGKGTKQMGDLGKEKKEAKDPSQMAAFEATLEAKKVVYEKENDLREMSKQAEIKYWQDLAVLPTTSAADRIAISKKVSMDELAILKEAAKTREQIEEERINHDKTLALGDIEAARAEAQSQVALGVMTNAQLIKEEEKLEQARFRITKQGIEDRLALLSKDPTKNVVALRKLNDELEAEEQAHANKTRQLTLKDNQETMKNYQDLFNKIGSSFSKTMTDLMTHQKTWSQAVKSMYKEGLSAVASYLAQYLEKKLAAFAMEKAINLAGIAGDSAKAGSGAASAMADIPYVGPVLAIAAMAAVFAATMGMQSNVKSARGGYDIPSGMNPMVQTHEEEMILPKEQANAVRDMAKGGAGGGLQINAIPMPGGFFMMHQDELMKVWHNGKKYGR
jgi:hypothetical protein